MYLFFSNLMPNSSMALAQPHSKYHARGWLKFSFRRSLFWGAWFHVVSVLYQTWLPHSPFLSSAGGWVQVTTKAGWDKLKRPYWQFIRKLLQGDQWISSLGPHFPFTTHTSVITLCDYTVPLILPSLVTLPMVNWLLQHPCRVSRCCSILPDFQ